MFKLIFYVFNLSLMFSIYRLTRLLRDFQVGILLQSHYWINSIIISKIKVSKIGFSKCTCFTQWLSLASPVKGDNILMFLSTTIFQIIDLQFATSYKDYAVKYLFWKFPIHLDGSWKIWISWLYNDCVSIGLHATYSPKYRSYEKDSMG